MDYMVNADRVWIKDLEHVLNYGNRISPRGMLVYEVLSHRSVISMSDPVIFNKHRKLGYKFMAAEAAWMLSGDDRVSTIVPYSKDISRFSDDGKKFFGAYGPKVADQLPYVVSTLHNDPSSRQAVINIWRENPGPTKDVPCTLSLQFLIREGKLHCVASMRSSDLWLGHPYDIFNFSAISFALLLQMKTVFDLNLTLGNLFLQAGSKHIYEKNIQAISDLLVEFEENGVQSESPGPVFKAPRYDYVDEFVQHLWNCANSEKGILAMYNGS